MIKFKSYKTSRFANDAWAAEIRAAQKRIEEQLLKDYARTTDKWETKVKFHAETRSSVSGSAYTGKFVTEYKIEIKVSDDEGGKIWGYVNGGTPPHVINVKKAKALHFLSEYTPKTTPGSYISGRGGSGGSDVYTKQVRHPGTKARNFDETIAQNRQKWFDSEMIMALWKAAQKAGFTINK